MAYFLLLEEPFLVPGGATSVLHQFYGSMGSQVGAPSKDTFGSSDEKPSHGCLGHQQSPVPCLMPYFGALISLGCS